MNAGDEDANTGMAKEIFLEMDVMLEKTKEELLKQLNLDPTSEDGKKVIDAIDAAKPKTKKLSYSIAAGVVRHLTHNTPNSKAEYAETFSSSVNDQAFWSWLNGFVNVFRTWEPNTGVQGLKDSLNNFPDEVPQSLKGVLK